MTGQILCPQHGISVAESQMFLLVIRPLVVMSMKKSLLLQARLNVENSGLIKK